MLGLVVRLIILVGSISLNVRMSPMDTLSEVHVFVSSVIILVSCAQAMVIFGFCWVMDHCFHVKIDVHSTMLFAPLTKALATNEDSRHGDFDGDGEQSKSLFVLTDPKILDNKGRGLEAECSVDDHMVTGVSISVNGSVADRCEQDDNASCYDDDIFFEDIDVVTHETPNVYTDIYLLGIATFCIFYSVDTVSTVPCYSFLVGLSIASIRDIVSVFKSLLRGNSIFHIGIARILTLNAFMMIACAQICFGISFILQSQNTIDQLDTSFLNVMLAIALPLLSPCMLLTLSPKKNPLVTIQECSPFIVTMAFWYIAFFLSLRGHLHSAVYSDTNGTAIDIDMGIEMEQSFHLDTAVDHGYNIPWIIFSPIIKVLAMSIIIASIINRRNLEVLCPIQFILGLRELSQVLSLHQDITYDVITDDYIKKETRIIIMALIFTIIACASTLAKEFMWRNIELPRKTTSTKKHGYIFSG